MERLAHTIQRDHPEACPHAIFLKSLAVIVVEQLEDLLGDAAEARATYLEALGQLGWLLRHHVVPSADARPRQLVAGADTAPAMWPEAKAAGVAAMEEALAALQADPEAIIT